MKTSFSNKSTHSTKALIARKHNRILKYTHSTKAQSYLEVQKWIRHQKFADFVTTSLSAISKMSTFDVDNIFPRGITVQAFADTLDRLGEFIND